MINFDNREKDKVLFLLHTPPPIHGSSVVGLSIKKSKIINERFRCSFVNILSSVNTSSAGIFTIDKAFRFIKIWLHSLYLILTQRPKLCYLALTTTGGSFYKDITLIALLKLFRIKRVYHLHNKGVSLLQNKSLNNLLYRFAFKDAEVILLSRRLYPDIQKYVPSSKIHICPNGVPDENVTSKIRIDKNLNLQSKDKDDNEQKLNTPIQILFLSNLIESKGLFILLEACSILKKRNIPFHCTFIGDKGDVTENDFINNVNKLNLTDRVSLFGQMLESKKREAFMSADIFTLPTYYAKECFPLVILEAMSFSLPIVATSEGGIPDEIEDGINGYIIHKKDPNSLALRLEDLIIKPDLRKEMGSAGRAKYLQEFTLEKFENRIIEILNQVIKKPK